VILLIFPPFFFFAEEARGKLFSALVLRSLRLFAIYIFCRIVYYFNGRPGFRLEGVAIKTSSCLFKGELIATGATVIFACIFFLRPLFPFEGGESLLPD
jgi:hypothetical protein